MMRTVHVLAAFLLFLGIVSCEPTPQAPETEPSQATEPQEAEEPIALSPAEQLESVHAALEELKSELANEGKYSCCVFPSCNWCALHEGQCACYPNVEANMEVCPGCGLGWHNGNGMVEGFTAEDVKWGITHEHPAEGGHAH